MGGYMRSLNAVVITITAITMRNISFFRTLAKIAATRVETTLAQQQHIYVA